MTDAKKPARRLRHGQRPTEKLVFDEALHPEYVRAISEESPIAAHIVECTQVAANNAAEEGGLPALPDALEIDWPELHSQALGCGVEDRSIHDRYEAAEYGWQDGVDKAIERVPPEIYDADQMREYALLAIAADRASRQVANKAEQASAIFDKNAEIAKFEEWIENDREITGENGIDPAIKKACETTWIAAKVEAWLFGAVANKAEVEPVAWMRITDITEWADTEPETDGWTPLYATPPATTGASTVLTDERIIEEARDWGLLDIQDGGRVDRSALIGFVREVAAQAGQVAVPEDVLRVVRRLLDGSQPQDVPGALMVIDTALAGGAA